MSETIDTADVTARITKIINKQLDNIPEGSITLETSFEDLEVDSFAIVEMIFNLEEEFDIDLSNGDIHEFSTVGNLVDELLAHLKSLRPG